MDIGKLNGPPEEAQTSFVETNTTGNHVIPHTMRMLRISRHLLDHSTQARAKAPAAATYWATAEGIRPSIKTYVQSQGTGDSPCATHEWWCNCRSHIVATMATSRSKEIEMRIRRIMGWILSFAEYLHQTQNTDTRTPQIYRYTSYRHLPTNNSLLAEANMSPGRTA